MSSQPEFDHVPVIVGFPNVLASEIYIFGGHVGEEGVSDVTTQVGVSPQGQPGETRLFQSQIIESVMIFGLPLSNLTHELVIAAIVRTNAESRKGFLHTQYFRPVMLLILIDPFVDAIG